VLKKSLFFLMAIAMMLSIWLAPDSCRALETEFAPETIAQWIEEGQNFPDENTLTAATTHIVQFEKKTDDFAAIVTAKGRIMYEAWHAKQKASEIDDRMLKSIIDYPSLVITVFMFGDSILDFATDTTVGIFTQSGIMIKPFTKSVPPLPEKSYLSSHKYMKRLGAYFSYDEFFYSRKIHIYFTRNNKSYRTSELDLAEIE